MHIEKLFAPRGVAFVGATPDPNRYNGRVLQYALASGYEGEIYPVNPKYESLFEHKCYPDLASIPGPVDVVVVLVGPGRLPDLLRQCREKGVGYAVALGDLVAPDAEDKEARYAELRDMIADGGPRIVGPVCVGVVRPPSRLAMTMSSGILAGDAPAGPIGLVSQSGGILSSALDRAHQFGGGFSALVSSGGEFDLNIADFVEYLIDDPQTKCIALYAEKLVDPKRLFALADRAFERDKPILLLKGGTSPRGAESALTHSGAIASDLAVEDAALRRHRIVRVRDVDDLLMTARTLAEHRVDPDLGVAAVSQSGGYCTLVADTLSRADVPIADPTAATVERIMRETPVPRVGNPHDSASGPPGNNAPNSRAALLAFQDDPNVGATLYAETMYMYQDEGHVLQHDVIRHGRKPHLICWQGGKATERVIGSLRRDGAIVFDSLHTTVSALDGLYRYARLRRQHAPDAISVAAEGPLPDTEGVLPEAQAKSLLRAFGVPLVDECVVRTPKQAAEAASAMGYPVALKGIAAGVSHKSEAGLVALGLDDAASVAAACEAMAAGSARVEGYLVQKMVETGVEFILGAKNDVALGPAVLFGFGGLFVEAMGPPLVEMAPIDRPLAETMIDRVDSKGILSGYRTGRPLDRNGLIEAIVALSRLAAACSDRLESVDLNPVMVTAEGTVAVDAVVAFRSRRPAPGSS